MQPIQSDGCRPLYEYKNHNSEYGTVCKWLYRTFSACAILKFFVSSLIWFPFVRCIRWGCSRALEMFAEGNRSRTEGRRGAPKPRGEPGQIGRWWRRPTALSGEGGGVEGRDANWDSHGCVYAKMDHTRRRSRCHTPRVCFVCLSVCLSFCLSFSFLVVFCLGRWSSVISDIDARRRHGRRYFAPVLWRDRCDKSRRFSAQLRFLCDWHWAQIRMQTTPVRTESNEPKADALHGERHGVLSLLLGLLRKPI